MMPGLTATFYNYGNGLPNPQLATSRTYPYVGWSGDVAEVPSYFTVVWTGVIMPSVSGNHTFQLNVVGGTSNMQC